ncbi:hypothetical protein CRENBAI_011269 [Crenichthys baileyi]|uniref:Uncharacterized protein n=1 Tax=Crenichthys baileyi TaxID=28760 RepID=A0AAV9RRP3_9TELE
MSSPHTYRDRDHEVFALDFALKEETVSPLEVLFYPEWTTALQTDTQRAAPLSRRSKVDILRQQTFSW